MACIGVPLFLLLLLLLLLFLLLLLLLLLLYYICKQGAKGNWVFRISDLVKNPDGTDM